MFNMNLEEIDKYIKWKDRWSNKENIDIYQYISFNIHPDDILIIGKLLFPETIEIEDCIFLHRRTIYHHSYRDYLCILSLYFY